MNNLQGKIKTATLLAVVLVAAVSCTRSPSGPDDVPGSVASLIETVRQQGVSVAPMEQMSRDLHCLSVGPWRLEVNAEHVYAFEYESGERASRAAAGISPDGSTITANGRACAISWTGPPRFYRQDRLIVLYAGTNQDVIRILDGILGSPFAHR